MKSHLTQRGVGYLLFLLPFLVTIPLSYWADRFAGSWFVSTNLPDEPPEHRQLYLEILFTMNVAAIGVLCWFAGFIVLASQTYRTAKRISWHLFGALILLIPAIFGSLLLAFMVQSYFQFS